MDSPELEPPAKSSFRQFVCDLSRLTAVDSTPDDDLDSEWSGLSDNCILCSDERYPCTLEPQALKILGVLHISLKTTVYAAHCDDGTEVVLKFTNKRERIVREYQAYNDKLSSLQDILIPKFYGMLSIQGTIQDSQYGSCLVIERFGTRIEEGTLRYLPVRTKYVLCLTYGFRIDLST